MLVFCAFYNKTNTNLHYFPAFVGSVASGLTFCLCSFAGVLCDVIGLRQTAIIGAVIGSIGIFASAFVKQLELLYVTYGTLLGVGGALTFCPSLVILGHYFKRHIGIVNGINAFGSAIFTIIMTLVVPIMLETLKIKYTFIILAVCFALIGLCSLVWKPVIPNHKQGNIPSDTGDALKSNCVRGCGVLNTKLFRNKSYILWCVCMAICMFGYFIPFVHLVSVLCTKNDLH